MSASKLWEESKDSEVWLRFTTSATSSRLRQRQLENSIESRELRWSEVEWRLQPEGVRTIVLPPPQPCAMAAVETDSNSSGNEQNKEPARQTSCQKASVH